MIVRTATQRPMIFAVCFLDGQVVDAGKPQSHQAVVVEFPLFWLLNTIGEESLSGLVTADKLQRFPQITSARDPKVSIQDNERDQGQHP